MSEIIEGRNPVIEALKSEREVTKILVLEGNREGSIKKIISMANDQNVTINYVGKNKINSIATSDNHQGVIAYVSDHHYYEVEEIVATDAADSFVIICDEITDPHNLGAIVRTADAAGAAGVIIPKRRSVHVTPVVSKTSAGATEYVKIARVTNLNRTIDELKERGYWIVGADMDGDRNYFEADLKGKIGLVIGSEGKGVSRMVKERCDFVVRIPMNGNVTSLNASAAASILMYEIVRQTYGKG
ncbi:MAG: 23S rRNA (guanosine(2251)-2'-O)-methyltransferase RlmB [Clostridia bacterium]|nr:23S rRNA (guanosine(2251)-2'-O)-methyltransferase RlmB [Clostridia bacterium]